ncbi:MAG: GTPase HflX [Chromatiales bacterium]|nr:MAG: GTPase HflX [Chromatiales bacterium]
MFERPRRGELAILLHVGLGEAPDADQQQEFRALADAAEAEIAGELSARLREVNPRTLIGTGKLAELAALAEQTGASLLLVDHPLTPGQERNLERELKLRVVNRTGLILDIFALRARTFEGKLQVELAQLRHLSTRLVRGWTHLERQKGGIGLRGPGETQLETDRRLLARRIKQLQARLERLGKRRALSAQRRRKRDLATVSLVGYTNAGKSTLFNRLTEAGVVAADQLFATLDPTLRRIELPDGTPCVLADTVGFIRDLPHELVAAFHSTLEESRGARLLLHVVDCTDEEVEQRIADVDVVLRQIGADHLPVVQVFNKIDILGAGPRVDRAETGMPSRVWVSATTGDGIESLLGVISEYLHQELVRGTVRLGVTQARLRSLLYDAGQVLNEQELKDGGWELDVELDRQGYEQLRRREDLKLIVPDDDARRAVLN